MQRGQVVLELAAAAAERRRRAGRRAAGGPAGRARTSGRRHLAPSGWRVRLAPRSSAVRLLAAGDLDLAGQLHRVLAAPPPRRRCPAPPRRRPRCDAARGPASPAGTSLRHRLEQLVRPRRASRSSRPPRTSACASTACLPPLNTPVMKMSGSCGLLLPQRVRQVVAHHVRAAGCRARPAPARLARGDIERLLRLRRRRPPRSPHPRRAASGARAAPGCRRRRGGAVAFVTTLTNPVGELDGSTA